MLIVPTGPLVLLTQFWTIYTNLESQGQLLPKENWGIHVRPLLLLHPFVETSTQGLWPDYCDGSYTQWCDLSKVCLAALSRKLFS